MHSQFVVLKTSWRTGELVSWRVEKDCFGTTCLAMTMVTMVKRRLLRHCVPRNDKEDGGQKQIKGSSRKMKIELIEKSNKAWVDLYLTL
jgi:hypothetical protein